ncbi:MAG TPA: hypothetical protein IAC04_06830 [Candidatus Coprenecus stercoravium]|uniref:PKD domain-containing protein n=1 Tax=Candidatus Coprenecus stercoravium TaxID=2840735 RepID=A0A9D2GRD8_9BACT|nr:hypothetical protein [Candidatus Coprenecus stercoravium]
MIKTICKMSFLLTAVLAVMSCEEETVTPNEPPVVEEEESTQSVLKVTHSNAGFQVPAVSGGTFSEGTVDWGDGSAVEAYSEDLSHDYESDGPYTVTISCTGAEKVAIENISGITNLDISGF